VPLSHPQLAVDLLSPNHPLRLHDTKKTRFVTALQLAQSIRNRLTAVQMANRHPLFVTPLFDGVKSLCHNKPACVAYTLSLRRKFGRERSTLKKAGWRVQEKRSYVVSSTHPPFLAALPLASFFGLMSFNRTVGLDCFGCLDAFVFMAVVISLFAVFPAWREQPEHGAASAIPIPFWDRIVEPGRLFAPVLLFQSSIDWSRAEGEILADCAGLRIFPRFQVLHLHGSLGLAGFAGLVHLSASLFSLAQGGRNGSEHRASAGHSPRALRTLAGFVSHRPHIWLLPPAAGFFFGLMSFNRTSYPGT